MRIETRIAPILAALLLTAPALSSDKPQSQRCAATDAAGEIASEKPLTKGEYVIVFRIFGEGNWDRQAVLVSLDPALKPGPAEKAGPK